MDSIFYLIISFFKKNYLVGLMCLCFNVIAISGFTQQEDYFKSKFKNIESLSYREQNVIVREYLESGLNINKINHYVLWYYEFSSIPNHEVYKDIFSKTSFSNDTLQEDSLYFLMRIKLFDSKYLEAENIYLQIENIGKKYKYIGAKTLSNSLLGVDSKKSLYYHNKFFNFNVIEYVNKDSYPVMYWRDLSSYFAILSSNRMYDTIVIYCDSVLQYRPNNERWLERKAEAQYYSRKYKDASETYSELYQIKPKFSHVNKLLSSYMNINDTLSIITLLADDIKLKGEKDINIRYLLFEFLGFFQYEELKDSLIQDVLSKEPDFYTANVPSEALYFYSFFQFYNNQNKAATNTLQLAINKVKENKGSSPYKSNTMPPRYYQIQGYYVNDGEGDMFISKYYNLMGWFYEKRNRKKKALQSYRESVAAYECNIDSYYSMAYLYRISLLNKSDEIINCYERILSCDLTSKDILNAKSELAGIYYYYKNQPEKVKELLLPYLSGDMLKKGDYLILSYIYEREANYSESIKMLDKVLEMETDEWLIEHYQGEKDYLIEYEKNKD